MVMFRLGLEVVVPPQDRCSRIQIARVVDVQMGIHMSMRLRPAGYSCKISRRPTIDPIHASSKSDRVQVSLEVAAAMSCTVKRTYTTLLRAGKGGRRSGSGALNN